jgi:hypothetical protein
VPLGTKIQAAESVMYITDRLPWTR